MTTQVTILNKQADNLLTYIEKYKAKFEERLVAYNAVGQLEWNAGSWHFGEKGVAWLKETKDRGFKWDEVSGRVKGLSQMDISSEFQSFMRAYHMQLVCISGGLPAGSTLDKPLQVMKRWYWEMVNKTGQKHPMYLTADIIYAAMERHHENSDSPDNVSDYCDIAVKAIALLRQYDLFLVNIEVKNKYPCRNGSNSTKERKKAQQAAPDQTDDERLISIRAFMCVIELISLAETGYQRIFYNMLLLTIICGFRFQEIMLLKMTSLVKREITDKEKRQHAIDQHWPTYRLGIEYLGAKKAGWRIHWLAPSTYPVVEMIYKSVQELTSEFRKTIKGFRDSNFTNMLPGKIADFPDEWIEQNYVPRHNINTFLAIAGVTDHIQAILMGRVDITQNKHYQHQAESQSYQTASLAINMLEKAYNENNQALTKSFQLSPFTPQQKPSIPVNLPSPRTEVSRRMAALSRSSKTAKNTGVANVKLTASIMINPEFNIEHNLKQNMQTFGETTAEVADYIAG
ncbi:hypothetical protein OYS96_27515, partial [Raoultella ornithinolytica]|nr:hypothetical protein [Raoultella ornithinolytica]